MNVRKLASTIELAGDTYYGRRAVAVGRCYTLAAHIVYYMAVDRNRVQRPNYTTSVCCRFLVQIVTTVVQQTRFRQCVARFFCGSKAFCEMYKDDSGYISPLKHQNNIEKVTSL